MNGRIVFVLAVVACLPGCRHGEIPYIRPMTATPKAVPPYNVPWVDFCTLTGSNNLCYAMNGKATVQVRAGTPQGFTACAAVGWDHAYDSVAKEEYVCSTVGAAAAAVWTKVTGTGSGSVTFPDFKLTLTSGTVVTVAAGTYSYGTNVVTTAGPVTFTLQNIPITSIVTSATQTEINVNAATPVTSLIDGQALHVVMQGCAGGTGVFVASADTATHFYVAANTTGCTFTGGSIGATAGGTAIVFGNAAGQLEFSHSAAMGAIVSVGGPGAVATQTATGIYPNGAKPFGLATVAAGAWSAVLDQRAVLSSYETQAGPGIDVAMFGGQVQVGVSSNVALVDRPSVWLSQVDMGNALKVLPWRTGTGSPNARDNCTKKGEAYFDAAAIGLWVCSVPGNPATWVQPGGGGGATPPANTPAVTNNFVTAYNATTGAFTLNRPTCANLSDAGTGCAATIANYALLVSPAFTTPSLGAATATTINGTQIPAAKVLITKDSQLWERDFVVYDPVLTDSGRNQFEMPLNVTVTRLSCSTLTAGSTMTINLDKRALATPNMPGTAVLATGLPCDSNSEVTTTIASGAIVANAPVAITFSALTSIPDTLRIHVQGTVD